MRIGDVFKVGGEYRVLVSETAVNCMFLTVCDCFHVPKENIKNYELLGRIETGNGTRARLEEFIKNCVKTGLTFSMKNKSDAIVKLNGEVIGIFKPIHVSSVQYFQGKNKTVFKNANGDAVLFLDGNQVKKYLSFKEKENDMLRFDS